MADDTSFMVEKPSKIEQRIDIMVPTHNRLELTIKCMEALYENTIVPFNLIVVDDSTDVVTPVYFEEFKKNHDNLTFIHSDRPYKCGNQILNIGLKHAKTPFMAPVMNSIRVEPEWEIVALQLMREDPKIGVIAFKCLFPDGHIESAGITMRGYTPLDIGRDLPGHRLALIYECPAVQWAFALLRVEAAKDKLDENLFHGFRGWDDIDDCFVLKKNGWKIIYCGYGVGYHNPRATRGRDAEWAHKANRENARIFYRRWGYWKKFKKDYPEEAKLDKGV